MQTTRSKVLSSALAAFALVLMGAGCSNPANTPAAQSPEQKPEPEPVTMLTVEKEAYGPGEQITVTFNVVASDAENMAENAWVGIIPTTVAHGSEAENDKHDVSFQYLSGATSGSKTFNSPGAGQWDARLFTTDNDGTEIASVSFSVAAPTVEANVETTVQPVVNSQYPNGTKVYAQWTGNSWYRGTVDQTCSGGFHVTYDDGYEKCVPATELTADTVPPSSALTVGKSVIAQWLGTPFYTATIIAVEENGQYKVRYYDNVEYTVSRSQIRLP